MSSVAVFPERTSELSTPPRYLRIRRTAAAMWRGPYQPVVTALTVDAWGPVFLSPEISCNTWGAGTRTHPVIATDAFHAAEAAFGFPTRATTNAGIYSSLTLGSSTSGVCTFSYMGAAAKISIVASFAATPPFYSGTPAVGAELKQYDVGSGSSASKSAVSPLKSHPWLKMACDQASSGNLRRAYATLYRGLDSLFLKADWREVAAVLDAVCSEQYPADFGIGAMRFASDAADRVPGWQTILTKLKLNAEREGLDAEEVLRGLLVSEDESTQH